MRIVDRGSQPVCNAEVLAHVTTLEAQYAREKRTNTIPNDLKAVIRDNQQGLTPSASIKLHTYFDRPTQPTTRAQQRAHYSPPAILSLTTTLAAVPYKLLQAEILQILNHVPRDVTELGMLLEDGDQRFSEALLEEMVQIVKSCLSVD